MTASAHVIPASDLPDPVTGLGTAVATPRVMTKAERLAFVTSATAEERASMLNCLSGYTPEGFDWAAQMVEEGRVQATERELASVTP